MSSPAGTGKKRTAPTETPMMAQYLRAKAEHPDALLLFRMGDFYETFFDDAHILARITGVTLTSRNAADADPIPLAGFPWHSAEPYIARLLQAGHRVAVCEQVEEPGKGKKLLERRIVEVLSPGTALGETLLRAGANNFIAAVRVEGDRFGVAAADISTGEFLIAEIPLEDAEEELVRLAPAEILVAETDREVLERIASALEPAPFRTVLDPWRFARERGRTALLEQFRVATLEGFELEELGPALAAAGALLGYAREQKQSDLGHLRPPRRLRAGEGLILDESTLRSLEVLEPLPGGSEDATLLGAIDRTMTAAGARRLRGELRRPPAEIGTILARQEAIGALLESRLRGTLRPILKATSDVERILGRLHCARAQPRDLGALRQTLREAPKIDALLRDLPPGTPVPRPDATAVAGLAERLDAALVDQPPSTLAEGGVFRDAWDPELAELRDLARDAKSWIARLQEEERRKTGIAGLKVGYNRVFGYYLEVTQSQLARVPEHYQRKQTLAGAERYLTPELKEFEQKVLHAEEGRIRRERALFDALCEEVRASTVPLQELALCLSSLDFLQSLAEVAAAGRWTRPKIDTEVRLRIVDGRHPVVEAALGPGKFIANDTFLDGEARQVAVLTGPNMAGKSTYLRQVGLITVLAHLGSWVPAAEAEIGLCDRVFTRVGAQDSLARGQSTFLVEMIETSRILHHATRRSLVLLDEVGRGTSTWDGLSIAWAVAEALEARSGPKPRTIFATHFHELTRLARPDRGFANLNVEVKEWGDRVIFLRRVSDGAADRSYGIHVAQLAGVPEAVVDRARVILERLEREARRITPAVDLAGTAVTREDGGPASTGGGTSISTGGGASISTGGGAPNTAGGGAPDTAAGGVPTTTGDGAPATSGVRATPDAGSPAQAGRRPLQLGLFAGDPPLYDELRSLDLDRMTPLEALAVLHRWQREIEAEGRG